LAVRIARSNLGVGRSAPLVAETWVIRRLIVAGRASCVRLRRLTIPRLGHNQMCNRRQRERTATPGGK
jgi:hypothetical protein